ncbi:TRAM domain-containing protein [Microbacterium sp. NPDC076911]|uniref:class I SAM-dependent RNA methyltransferase n=1 Tax=Microbacterium sp. NPDC076911 TaxID=3154958 RepID=UPI0034330461
MTESTKNAGDLIDLDVSGVAHGGVFVARHEGRVIFVPDALPGERIRARLVDTRKKSFWRAEALEVLDASPHRQAHVWRQADIEFAPEQRPGGADFGHIDLAYQRDLKLEVLTDSLKRFGGLDVPASIDRATPVLDGDGVVRDEETPDGTRWRTRVSLHVDADGRVGPYAARTHSVVHVDSYPLATEAIEQAAKELSDGAPGRIDLVQAADGRVRVVARPDERAPRPRSGANARAVREVVVESVNGKDFKVDAVGFWQVHRLAAHSLTAALQNALRSIQPEGPAIDPDAHHLDLYGGVGLFAATLATLGGKSTRVTTVESSARATEHAAANLSGLSRARAETGRVDRWLKALQASATAADREQLSRGVVVLDPPRAGAGREVVQRVADLSPATIVYVACDPVALSRDLATFRDAGYEAPRVDALDLFPNSHHIEAIATLTRTTAPR